MAAISRLKNRKAQFEIAYTQVTDTANLGD
jgi:hypothetical protein